MIIKNIDKNNYLIKIFNKFIDIYDKDEIEELVRKVFSKIMKKEKIHGDAIVNIYVNDNYGIIIKIEVDNNCYYSDELDLKIIMHLNNNFLFEIDYFNLKELNIKNQNIYYYNDKFYLEIVNPIDNKDLLKLSDFIFFKMDDTINIINKGIKIKD